jgi:hypothetical protein
MHRIQRYKVDRKVRIIQQGRRGEGTADSMNRNTPSPKTRAIAQQLVAHEGRAGNPAEPNAPAAFRVSEKLRRPLSTLVGATGFRALLARALALTKAQVPGLDALQIKPDGSLDGLGEVGVDQQSEAGAVVIAQLLALLDVFIGNALTQRLVADIWPDLPAFDVEPYGETSDDAPR